MPSHAPLYWLFSVVAALCRTHVLYRRIFCAGIAGYCLSSVHLSDAAEPVGIGAPGHRLDRRTCRTAFLCVSRYDKPFSAAMERCSRRLARWHDGLSALAVYPRIRIVGQRSGRHSVFERLLCPLGAAFVLRCTRKTVLPALPPARISARIRHSILSVCSTAVLRRDLFISHICATDRRHLHRK